MVSRGGSGAERAVGVGGWRECSPLLFFVFAAGTFLACGSARLSCVIGAPFRLHTHTPLGRVCTYAAQGRREAPVSVLALLAPPAGLGERGGVRGQGHVEALHTGHSCMLSRAFSVARRAGGGAGRPWGQSATGGAECHSRGGAATAPTVGEELFSPFSISHPPLRCAHGNQSTRSQPFVSRSQDQDRSGSSIVPYRTVQRTNLFQTGPPGEAPALVCAQRRTDKTETSCGTLTRTPRPWCGLR